MIDESWFFTYIYDNRGNIISVSDVTYTTSYAYDILEQLICEDNEKNNRTYVYTYSNGNLLSRSAYEYTAPNLTPTGVLHVYNLEYTAYTWKDLLVKYDGVSMAYDGNGQITSFDGMALSWDYLGLLGSAGNTTYSYDTSGRRLSKTTGSTVTNYYYAGDLLVGQKTGNNKIEFIYDSNGDYYGFEYNDIPYNYIKNLQGDVIAIADGSANILVRYEYDAWGRHLKITDTTGIRLGNINPIRYRGYYFDEETGFYYLKTRYYSPEICRFLSADSVLDDSGVNSQNLFAYCANNPVIREDSGGQLWDTVFDVVSLVFSVVDVVRNPRSAWSWIGLAADVVSLVVPFATGGGAAVKAISKTDDIVDTVKTVDNISDSVDTISDVGKTTSSTRASAVKKAWENEYLDVKNGGSGISRNWTISEQAELLSTGKVKGYQGHHMKSVKGYPELAGDPNNIQFLTPKKHLDAHNGNWRNITHGRFIDLGG